jgi:hypothetical protein
MYNFTANDLILDCHHISAPQQVHLTFDSRQYNLGPDRREVIGIVVHVLSCHQVHPFHHIIIGWLQELYLFALLLPNKALCQSEIRLSTLSNGILQCSRKGIKLKCCWSTIGQHVAVALMNNVFCFVRARWYESFMLAGFKDLHCIWVWIPTYPIQMNASYIS